MRRIRVLILEDRDVDAQLMAHELHRAGLHAWWRRVDTERDFLSCLNWRPDLILADYSLPQFDALSALQVLQERRLDVPFIIVSGTIGEDLAVSVMQFGAADYLLKDRLWHLGSAALSALERQRAQHEKRRAEEELRKSEERLKLALDAASMGTSDWDLRTQKVVYSALTAELFGQQAGGPAPTYEEWLRVLHPADRDRVECAVREAVERGSNMELEYRVVRPDAGVRWIFSKATVLSDEAGRAVRVIGAHIDITQRKLAEEALREGEQWLKLAERCGGVGTWEWDLRTDRVRCSDEAQRLCGLCCHGEFACQRNWFAKLHPDDRAAAQEKVLRAIELGTPYEHEFRVVRPDGAVRWLSNRGQMVRDERGRPVRMFGAQVDISERKRGEEALARLAAIVQSSDDAIIGATLEGVIETWNRGAEKLFGYSAQEAVGRNAAMLLPAGAAEEVRQCLAQTARGEVVRMYDRVRLRKDGTSVRVSVTVSPIRDPAGRVRGAAAIVRDLTFRKQAEEQIRRMNDALRELSGRLIRSQDETRRHMARELHDTVGQDFVALAMHLSLLKTSPVLNADPRVEKIVAAGVALAEQCSRQVRSISYLLHPPLLDELGLTPALQAYTDGFRERTGICLELSVEPDFGRFHPELETTLFRIVQEALSNIHRHSGSRTASIRLARHNGSVRLEVRDQGCGIPAGLLDGSGTNVAGLGVGILGMRERARQLGGRLDIESDTGGTRITAELPAREVN